MSIFDSQCVIKVCPVNTKGVMGAGLAKKFKENYPKEEDGLLNCGMEDIYKDFCLNGECLGWDGVKRFLPGDVVIKPYPYPPKKGDTWKYIALFATKDHWRDRSKIEWIESGLMQLHHHLKSKDAIANGKTSIAVPALGCGLGGLKYSHVKPLIVKYLGFLGDNLEIYDVTGNLDTRR